MQRPAWYDAVQQLNRLLGEYELTIRRERGNVAVVRPDGNGKLSAEESGAYVYRVTLTKGKVTLSRVGVDQPEVVVPNLAMKLLETDGAAQGERSDALDAFEASVEAAILKRHMDARYGWEDEND